MSACQLVSSIYCGFVKDRNFLLLLLLFSCKKSVLAKKQMSILQALNVLDFL